MTAEANINEFDYAASAELFPARGRGYRRQSVSFKRFDSAADAIRYAVEELEPALLAGTILEVEEQRFDGVQIRNLYASADYPLKRGTAASGVRKTPVVW